MRGCDRGHLKSLKSEVIHFYLSNSELLEQRQVQRPAQAPLPHELKGL